MKKERVLRDIFHILKKRLKLILIITLACAAAAGILNYFIFKPVYEANTSVIVGKPDANSTIQTNYSDVMMYQDLIKTYSAIAVSRTVAERAAAKLGNKYSSDQILKAINLTNKTDTQILIISAQDGNAQNAVDISNAISVAFIEVSGEVFPTGGNIEIIDKPMVPWEPVKPNLEMNFSLSVLLGLTGSLASVFLLEIMEKPIETEEDVEKYLNLPVIGIIPKRK